MQYYIEKLSKLLDAHNVCPSHGIDHALNVVAHAEKALKYENLDQTNTEAVKLAALLHDADDRKFFPDNTQYENLKFILNDKPDDFVELVLQMVKLVSASTNGDNIPEYIKDRLWLLIPRYADRLEAIGIVGIRRCYVYGIGIGNPLFVDSTPRLTDEDQIIKLAQEKFTQYKGVSLSIMDHFYDKLIAIGIFPYSNPYFDNESKLRRQPIMDFVKYFGLNNDIDYSML